MASLIHKNFWVSHKEELDFFSISPTQTTPEKSSYVEYHPISTLGSTGPIEFVVPAESNSCVDLLNIMLHVHTKIKKHHGTDLADNSIVAPVCNFLYNWSCQVIFT